MLSLYILPNLPLHTPPCRNIPAPISGFGADVLCDVGEVPQGPPAMISPHQIWPALAGETPAHRHSPWCWQDTAGSRWLAEGQGWWHRGAVLM